MCRGMYILNKPNRLDQLWHWVLPKVITDKGSATIVLHNDSYQAKMEEVFQDEVFKVEK